MKQNKLERLCFGKAMPKLTLGKFNTATKLIMTLLIMTLLIRTLLIMTLLIMTLLIMTTYNDFTCNDNLQQLYL